MKKLSGCSYAPKALVLLFCAWCIFCGGIPAWAVSAPCYVNGAATGSNDGSTWTNAYTNPQFALLAPRCTEIWVAKGVYKPTLGSDSTVSFVILSGVQMYGGFSGDEVNRDDRLPMTNLTILSGDIDSNDANTSGSNIDDTYADIHGTNTAHVVVMNGSTGSGAISDSTVLDGFTITAGIANATGDAFGGGLLCNGRGNGRDDSGVDCSPLLRNLVFSGNAANSGGAVYDDATELGKSNPTFINVTFQGNHASQNGGAIANVADGQGHASPTLERVFFVNNDAALGGAFYNRSGTTSGESGTTSSPTIKDAMFVSNVADTGGGFYNHALSGGTAAPKFDSTTFDVNSTRASAGPYGGGLFSLAEGSGSVSSPTLVNSTFKENRAGEGGAIFDGTLSAANQTLVLINVTVSGNLADYGGGIANSAHTGRNIAELTNVIFWGNTASLNASTAEFENSGTTLVVSYGVVDSGCPLAVDVVCDHISGSSPNLGPLAENGGYTRTLLPGAGSSAIDAGLDSACPLVDQRGVTRPQGVHCDIGAVEFAPFAPPVAIPSSVTVAQNTSHTISLGGTDGNPNGPFTYTFAIVTMTTHGTLALAGDTATYTPDTNFTGNDTFTYTTSDKNGTSMPATVSITVLASPPVAAPLDVTMPHDTTKDMTLSATDNNSNGPFTYTFAIVSTAAHGTLTLAADVATYTSNPGYSGIDSFTYTVSDKNGTSAPASVTIHVGAIPPIPPIAQPRSLVLHRNASGSITFGATDSGAGGPYTYTFATTTGPTHGTLGVIEGATIVYTPNHDYSGSDSFAYTATDVNGTSVPAIVTITVLPASGGPGSTDVSRTPSLSSVAMLMLSMGMVALALFHFRIQT